MWQGLHQCKLPTGHKHVFVPRTDMSYIPRTARRQENTAPLLFQVTYLSCVTNVLNSYQLKQDECAEEVGRSWQIPLELMICNEEIIQRYKVTVTIDCMLIYSSKKSALEPSIFQQHIFSFTRTSLYSNYSNYDLWLSLVVRCVCLMTNYNSVYNNSDSIQYIYQKVQIQYQ